VDNFKAIIFRQDCVRPIGATDDRLIEFDGETFRREREFLNEFVQ
jgi:hypothetical protein